MITLFEADVREAPPVTLPAHELLHYQDLSLTGSAKVRLPRWDQPAGRTRLFHS